MFTWASRIPSRETPYGVWQDKKTNEAWKIYPRKIDEKKKTDNLRDLSADYRRAQVDVELPMGNPRFQEGKVQQGSAKAVDGFALITEWMTGNNFQKTVKPLKAALTAQNISHDRFSQEYLKIKRGCDGANTVGLKDCQGFIHSGISSPIRFIDIHTSWNAQLKKYGTSEQAQMLVDTIVEWGK